MFPALLSIMRSHWYLTAFLVFGLNTWETLCDSK